MSATSASPSPSVISLPTPASSSAPATSAAPTTAKAVPTTPAPSGSVCPVKETALIHIDSVGVDSATGLNRITAEPAEEICGPGVEDDYYFKTTGPAAGYDVSTAAKIQILNDQNELVTVTWAQFKAGNIGIYGGYYGIDEGNTGLITVIDQYFHP